MLISLCFCDKEVVEAVIDFKPISFPGEIQLLNRLGNFMESIIMNNFEDLQAFNLLLQVLNNIIETSEDIAHRTFNCTCIV